MASSINQEKAPTTNSNLLGQERDKSETILPWFYKCFFSIRFWKAGCTWAVVKSSNRWRTFVLLSQKKVRYYLNVFEFLFLRTLDSCWNLKSSFWRKRTKMEYVEVFCFWEPVAGFCWFGILKCTSIFGTDASQGSGKEFQNQHQKKLKICKKMDVCEYVHQW